KSRTDSPMTWRLVWTFALAGAILILLIGGWIYLNFQNSQLPEKASNQSPQTPVDGSAPIPLVNPPGTPETTPTLAPSQEPPGSPINRNRSKPTSATIQEQEVALLRLDSSRAIAPAVQITVEASILVMPVGLDIYD